ncbi:ribokinase [Alienimonas californiensis]|uniref:Ribokinase n=1 Tax=Alienimonas californiensis TaxID=2527989 RepID=A0A517P8Q1_9PLAN|nr:ribokinase [Alienimonas californiensis]QDT15742.1 Ribokinase [Alienimonas californiensis]
MSPAAPRVVVLGSLNTDLVVRCAELPAPGQTVAGRSVAEFGGGKGANQAVAAALAGGDVAMVGAVGEDAASGRLVDGLVRRGVDCGAVVRRAGTRGGTAVITVDDRGQNSIVVVPGANGTVGPADVAAAEATIAAADVLLVQLEIPVDAVLAGVAAAKRAGVRVIFDPAPAVAGLPDELFAVDLLCPNETEAAILSGLPVKSPEDAERAADRLRERGATRVAVTLGDAGTLLCDAAGARLIPPFPVIAVDTTAAGDAFAGALAVRWAATDDLDAAVRFANAAGALAASAAGAQDSMATAADIHALMADR